MGAFTESTKSLIHKSWRSAVQERLPEPASAILLKSPVSIRLEGTTAAKWRASETQVSRNDDPWHDRPLALATFADLDGELKQPTVLFALLWTLAGFCETSPAASDTVGLGSV